MHNLGSPAQNENSEPLVQIFKFQRGINRALNQAQDPSKCRDLCNCSGHVSMKPELQEGAGFPEGGPLFGERKGGWSKDPRAGEELGLLNC